MNVSIFGFALGDKWNKPWWWCPRLLMMLFSLIWKGDNFSGFILRPCWFKYAIRALLCSFKLVSIRILLDATGDTILAFVVRFCRITVSLYKEKSSVGSDKALKLSMSFPLMTICGATLSTSWFLLPIWGLFRSSWDEEVLFGSKTLDRDCGTVWLSGRRREGIVGSRNSPDVEMPEQIYRYNMKVSGYKLIRHIDFVFWKWAWIYLYISFLGDHLFILNLFLRMNFMEV